MTERDKVLKGNYYSPFTPALTQDRENCMAAIWRFKNATNSSSTPTFQHPRHFPPPHKQSSYYWTRGQDNCAERSFEERQPRLWGDDCIQARPRRSQRRRAMAILKRASCSLVALVQTAPLKRHSIATMDTTSTSAADGVGTGSGMPAIRLVLIASFEERQRRR